MSEVTDNLARLEVMGLAELRATWAQAYRSPAPPAMSRELLRQAIGFRMQEQGSGGPGRRLVLQIRAMEGRRPASAASRRSATTPSLKPGAKLLREWRGRIHEVLALDTGQFAYGGRTYRSLSEIAREITGAQWSGPRFFGLKVAGSGMERKADHG